VKLFAAGLAIDVAIEPATSSAAIAIIPSLTALTSADVVVVNVRIMEIPNSSLSSVNMTRAAPSALPTNGWFWYAAV
jgi:hypothetical protein